MGGVHRHTPEIEQAFAEAAGVTPVVSFTPLLAPMPRGILATCTARLAPAAAPGTAAPRGTADPGAPRQALASAYAGEPFIHVLPEGHWPSTASTVGSNAVHLQAVADPHAGRAVVVSALDNLVKGAAGQAIQIANLMLGLPEAAGLPPTESHHEPCRRRTRERGHERHRATGFPRGRRRAGLKTSGERDVAVVINDGPSRAAAAVFTRNRVKAAPVLWTQQVVAGGRVRAVALNSGGANACTGPLGFQDTHATAEQPRAGRSTASSRAGPRGPRARSRCAPPA